MKILSFVLTLSILISLIGCAGPSEPGQSLDVQSVGPAVTTEADKPDATAIRAAFDEFLDQQFKDYVTEDSISMQYLLRYPENYGIERIEPTLGEFGSAVFAELKEQYKEDIQTLKGFPYAELSEEQQLVYDIIDYYYGLDIELLNNDMQYYFSPLSPVSGTQSELPILLAEYKFYDERDVIDYLALLKDVDPYLQSILKFEREKSEKGLFMADFTVNSIIESCGNFTAHKENNF